MLFEKIQQDLVRSMKDKDESRTGTLRYLIAALKNAKIELMVETLPDAEVEKVVQRQVKQHRDSIAQYLAGQRPELAAKEEAEVLILQEYLPAQLTETALTEIIKAKQQELNITEKSGQGRLMGEVMKAVKGQADGNQVKTIVEQLLN